MAKKGFETIANYPLVDLNWLAALAWHYKVTETEEWKVFRQQQIAEVKRSGEDLNESFITLN